MSIKRLFDVVERRGDIGRRVAALVLPISNRPRVTSGCAGKIGLRESGEHTSGPNLASRDNVAHSQTLYTILETPPPSPALSKAGPDRPSSRGTLQSWRRFFCCGWHPSIGRRRDRLRGQLSFRLYHGAAFNGVLCMARDGVDFQLD